ncbi:hypothetical protein [Streptomyces mexicanus]|jgi:hypothetical protein|uniref:hypothetical protein n=1 Tax=Streptomyces mexicanus TaxID=178566 RepID=UPI0036A04E1D
MVRRKPEPAGNPLADPRGEGAGRPFPEPGRPGRSERHERVFQAVSAVQERRGGAAGHLEEIARACGLPPEETRGLLDDLTRSHGPVTELAGGDEPDLGPRFEVKPRL